ncbi:MAG: ester cyclase [Nitriliruptorales bacterium]|nr:ester cyclase [Nitriliruptorales bacterium]
MADTREVIRRLNEDVFGKGNVDIVDELLAEDYVDHTGIEGPMDREGLKAFVKTVHEAGSDWEVDLQHVLVDGDQVAWRWKMRGKHTGEFMGIPPSGNTLEITGNDIGIMEDGKLKESWGEMDMLDLMTQLGALDDPTG